MIPDHWGKKKKSLLSKLDLSATDSLKHKGGLRKCAVPIPTIPDPYGPTQGPGACMCFHAVLGWIAISQNP